VGPVGGSEQGQAILVRTPTGRTAKPSRNILLALASPRTSRSTPRCGLAWSGGTTPSSSSSKASSSSLSSPLNICIFLICFEAGTSSCTFHTMKPTVITSRGCGCGWVSRTQQSEGKVAGLVGRVGRKVVGGGWGGWGGWSGA